MERRSYQQSTHGFGVKFLQPPWHGLMSHLYQLNLSKLVSVPIGKLQRVVQKELTLTVKRRFIRQNREIARYQCRYAGYDYVKTDFLQS